MSDYSLYGKITLGVAAVGAVAYLVVKQNKVKTPQHS